MANIGDRRKDGKIYAGPDYGYQSPDSYQQLEQDGAFKLGASAVRRGKQLVGDVTDAITSRIPEPVKELAGVYGERLVEADQRQQQINQGLQMNGGIAGFYVDLKQAVDQKRQQDVNFLSDKTNIAPELISGAVTATEMAVDARMGATAATDTLSGMARRMPATTAYASGGAMKIDTSIIPGMKMLRDEQGKALPGIDRIVQRDGKTYAWFPTEQPEGTRVDPFTGRVPVTRTTDTGRGWQLEEVQLGKDADGNPVMRTVDSPRNQLSATPVSQQIKDTRKPLDQPGGSTRQTPESQAQFNEPEGTRTRRAEAQDTTPPETFLDVEDVHTSDMAQTRSDGNRYIPPAFGGDDVLIPVPAKERNAQRQKYIDKLIDERIGKAIRQRADSLKLDDLDRELFLADGDYDKLSDIAKMVNVDPSTYKQPSQLERAIQKRLSGLKNTYGGKATVTVDERKAIERRIKADQAGDLRQTNINAANADIAADPRRSTTLPRSQGDTRLPANTDADDQFPFRTTAKPPTKTYRTDEILERRDRKFYMDNYEYKIVKNSKGKDIVEFLLDENGAYIPKKGALKPSSEAPDPDFARKIRRRMRP